MSTAGDAVRNGLLIEGLGKPVDLNAVDWHVRHRNPSASPSEIQSETLELIRAVVSDGLFRLGSVGEKDERFVAWRRSLDHSINKISHVYVKHYDDPEKWMFAAWLSLTAKGEQLAQCLEEKTSTYIEARASELREPATGPAGQARHRRRPGRGLHDRQPLHRKIVRQFPD